MAKRIVFGSLMIAAVAGLLYLDWRLELWARGDWLTGLPVAAGLAAVALAGLAELRKLTAAAGAKLLPVSGAVAVAGLATLPYWWPLAAEAPPSASGLLVLLSLSVAAVFAEQMLRARTADALRRVGTTLLAAVYLGACTAVLLAARMDFGVAALVLVLAAVKFTDIGAYFTGTVLGRHKLIPWLSPGKSWEGLAGGLAAGAGVAMLAAGVLGPPGLTIAEAALLGVALALAGQFADLCESLLKRSAELKDAGSAVPEFGGVLDIIDSPLLAAPVGYALLAALT